MWAAAEFAVAAMRMATSPVQSHASHLGNGGLSSVGWWRAAAPGGGAQVSRGGR